MRLRPENRHHRMLIALAFLVVLFVSITTIERANAQFPPSGQSFVKHFKKGDYGHYGKHKKYSGTYKKIYLNKFVREWKRHHKDHARLTVARVNALKNEQWDYFQGHDSCNSGMWGSTPNCWAMSQPQSYAKSIYGTGLTDTQRKWTLRVLWCGGVGVATFYTDGAIDAAIGNGALICMGGLFVP